MSLWTWLGGIFHGIKVKIEPIVVGILQLVQKAEDTGLLPGIAKILDNLTGSKLPTEVNDELKAELPKLLAVWLGIAGLPPNPTDQQEKDFANAIENAIISKKAQQTVPGEVISDLGVQIYNRIKQIAAAHVDGSKVTKAEIITAVEDSFQDLQNDIANAQADQAAAQDPNQ